MNLAPDIQLECFAFGSFKIPACTISVWYQEEEDGEKFAPGWEPVLYAYWERFDFLSWEKNEGAMGDAARQWSEEFQRKSWMCGFLIEASPEKKEQWIEDLRLLK